MKKASLLFTTILFIAAAACGQTLTPEVLPAGGGYFTGGGATLSFTIGQAYNTTIGKSGIKISQGEQQPEIDLLTGSIPANIQCEGFAIAVPFTGGGYLTPGKFTAQLSDVNGSFDSPIAIGSLTAAGSGVINAVIPAGINTGTHYRIRVVSNTPVFNGADNGEDVVITSPTASVTAAGPVTICAGGSVTLNANTGTGFRYQWQKNGTNIKGDTLPELIAKATGSYSVKITQSCGVITSSATAVTVNPRPAATITAQDTTVFCTGGSVVLQANYGSGYSYQWMKGNSPISGAVLQNYTVAATGKFRVAVTDGNGCSNTSTTQVVTVYPRPAASITSLGPITFCEGGSVELKAETTGITGYQWQQDGNPVGSSAALYTANTSGRYTVVVNNSYGCLNTSPAVIVSANICSTSPATIVPNDKLPVVVQVYPNPVHDMLTVRFTTRSTQKYFISLVDLSGKKILVKESQSVEGLNSVKLEVGHLARALYLLELQTPTTHNITKVALQ